MTYHHNMKQQLAALALLVLTPMTQAIAGDVRVTVGVKNANVCIGSLSEPAAYGAKKTDRRGEVTFRDVPDGRVQVTVSRSGYKSQSRRFNMTGYSSSVHAPIREGVGGPSCVLASVDYPNEAEQKEEQNSYSLKLHRISINSGASSTSSRSVKINNRVDGNPTHYRVSESATFDGAQWQDYNAAPEFQLSSGKGTKTVYFQVKKSVSVGKGSIDRESKIVSDNIRLR